MKILLLSPQPRCVPVQQFLETQGNSVTTWTDKITLEFVRERGFDFLISNGYAPIIKEPVISAYHHRIINIHASYLPYGRGMGANPWSFFEDTPKGVSVHFINAGVDTGDLIARKEVTLRPTETLRSSYEILLKEAEKLFFEKWPEVAEGRCKPTPQRELEKPGVRYYHSRAQMNRLLSLLPLGWDTPLHEVERLGRELQGQPERLKEIYGSSA